MHPPCLQSCIKCHLPEARCSPKQSICVLVACDIAAITYGRTKVVKLIRTALFICAVSESVCQSVAWNSALVIWSGLPLSSTSDMSELFTRVVCYLRQTDYAWLSGRCNSIVVHNSCVVKVPKFGIGPADNEQNANRLCRHSSADHSRLVIR